MKILLWHGYLLGGTGSNVYTRAIAREWSRAGHDVTVFCQERHPERYDLGGARVLRPRVPGLLLPVFVLDNYEGLQPKLLQDFADEELDRYIDVSGADLEQELPADLVFANHLLPGGAVAATSLVQRVAVKVHGSEIEYSIRGNPRLIERAKEVLNRSSVVYAGSEHIRQVLDDVCGHTDGVEIVPPGVDVEEFRPQRRDEALASLVREAHDVPVSFEEFFAADAPTVLYFGKLIENKGVHVLLEALRGLDARAVIVGFGDYRERLEKLAPPGTLFTGALEHRHLVHLLPLCDVAVVPSIFPEAFGMVAAEAAAAGVLPIVSDHSGLAEVAAGIGEEVGAEAAALLSFPAGDAAALRTRLAAILALPPDRRRELGLAARRAVERRWSWPVIAAQLLG